MPDQASRAEFRADIRAHFGDRVLVDEPLTKHTSARIGGPADVFFIARDAEELRTAASTAWEHNLPLTVLGGGSNILISDAGIPGLVILNKAQNVAVTGNTVIAESGVSSIKLARQMASRGLSGFEWAIGVPGTIGGAAYGNAGAHGGDMARNVTFVDLIIPTEQGIADKTLSNTSMAFQYRSSILKRDRWACVILGVMFEFTPDDPDAIKIRMDEYNAYRKRTQPPGATIGSMFKNPEGDYAGRLIEAAGLKGKRLGGAAISEIHANFFLNVEDATAQDVKALADLARETVLQQSGVELELEIELVGRW